MPVVPKRKATRFKTAQRFAGYIKKFSSKSLVACSTCKAKILPHTICKECGSYKGKKI